MDIVHPYAEMKFRRIHWVTLFTCLLAGLWIGFAKLVVPRVIESAYRGESVPFLNNIIDGRQEHSVGFYLQKWDHVAIDYLVSGLVIWLLILLVSSPVFIRALRKYLREGTPGPLPLSGARDIFNPFSTFALVLICVPLTIGAIRAFPVWDDAWLWLLIREHGSGMVAASVPDRPVMGAFWSLLAASEPAFWRVGFVAHAVLWPTLGIMSALLWTYLFPDLRRYSMVVGCVAVAPIISKVQLITAEMTLGHVLTTVLGYGAFLLLLRFVTVGDHFGKAALGLSIPILGFAILLSEFPLPVVAVMLVMLYSFAQRAPNAETKVRCGRAILFLILTAVGAYALFSIMADFGSQSGQTSPLYIVALGGTHLASIPLRLAAAIYQSIAGGFLISLARVNLASWSGAMAAGYGALVAGFLVYGCRRPKHETESPAVTSVILRDFPAVAVAFVGGLLPMAAMARLPWNPGDGMSMRFELPILPMAAATTVLISLCLVRRRFWAIPVFVLGFVAGSVTFSEARSAIRERQQMAALGEALRARISSEPDHSVIAIDLPDRSLGPQRPYELTARLTYTWPQELRRRFWAFRTGGTPPFDRVDLVADGVFGSRHQCKTPQQFEWGVRLVTRNGLLDQLLWVRSETDGSVSIEPYCMDNHSENQIRSQRASGSSLEVQ